MRRSTGANLEATGHRKCGYACHLELVAPTVMHRTCTTLRICLGTSGIGPVAQPIQSWSKLVTPQTSGRFCGLLGVRNTYYVSIAHYSAPALARPVPIARVPECLHLDCLRAVRVGPTAATAAASAHPRLPAARAKCGCSCRAGMARAQHPRQYRRGFHSWRREVAAQVGRLNFCDEAGEGGVVSSAGKLHCERVPSAEELRVENYAVIDNVVVEFGAGLNLLTGETGAGKSILIDALALLLGEKAYSDVVRHGAEKATIAAVYESDDPAIAEVLEENGIDAAGARSSCGATSR